MSTLSNLRTKFKAWYLNSGTVLLNRFETAAGFVVAAVAAMDWSPLWGMFGTGTQLNTQQLAGISGFLVLRGITGEWVRRRNAPLTSQGTLG